MAKEEVAALCPSCGQDVKKESTHCASPTCGWVKCRAHNPPIVIDPRTGRYYE